MSGGVRNLMVTNCTFMGTDIGLRFKSRRGRGGLVENIRITNIRMTSIPRDAISFNFVYGGQSPTDETTASTEAKIPPVTEETPVFRNFHFENIVCRGAQNAIIIQGLAEMPLRDIFLKNVSITSEKGAVVEDADGIHFDNVQINSKSGPQLSQTRVKNSSLELTR
jgi:polygalacturonase